MKKNTKKSLIKQYCFMGADTKKNKINFSIKTLKKDYNWLKKP